MKIEEYALIKLIKNLHPVNLERTLDHYAMTTIEPGSRQAIVDALRNKCLPQDLEIKYVRMFRSRR